MPCKIGSSEEAKSSDEGRHEMLVKQLSIFLENRSGRLSEVTKVLGKENVNIRALSLADTSDFGILRLIVDRPDEAYHILRQGGFTIRETDVLAVEVADQPGGLARVLDRFASSGVNVEYMYAFVEKSGDQAIMIFRVEDPEQAAELLTEGGVRLLSGDAVYAL
jgi:hypothetical protein